MKSGNKNVCAFSIFFFFFVFKFERNYDVLNSKSSRFLLNKNINFDKKKTESKMENPTHSFRETKLVL